MADQEIDDFKRALRELQDAVTDFRDNLVLNNKNLDKALQAQQNAVNNNTTATNNNTNATQQNTTAQQDLVDKYKVGVEVTKKAYASLKTFTGDSVEAANRIRESRESFQSLNPSIRVAGDVTKGLIGAFGSLIGSAVDLGSSFTGPLGKVAGALGGDLLGEIGTNLKEFGQEAVDVAVSFAEFSTRELDRAVRSFRQVGSVGALGAEGLTGLYNQSIQAGLGLDQFANIVSRNASGLAFATSSTLAGANAISNITAASKPFQAQFLALGIGLEEQSTFFAESIVRQRRLNQLQTRDYASQASVARDYVLQLDELARLTGLSNDAASAELDAQLRNVRFQATLAKALEQDPTGKLQKAISNTGVVISSIDKTLGEGFQDAFGGVTTQAAKQFELATGGAGRAIIEQLRSGAIGQGEALAQIQNAMNRRFQSLGGFEFAERVGKIGTAFDPMLLGMIRMSQASNLSADATDRVRQQQRAAAGAQDENTKNIVTAQQALQSIAQQFDSLALDVLPASITAVSAFTGILDTGVTYIGNLIKGNPVDERATGGPVTKGSPYLVGEEGPEIFTPGASGQISNANITSKLAAIAQGMSGVSDFGTGFTQSFMPGIGKVSNFTQGGLSKTVIEGLNGQIEEYTKYAFLNNVAEMYKSGGQTFGRSTASMDGVSISSGFRQVGGPRSYYDSVMGSVAPTVDATSQYGPNGVSNTTGQSNAQMVKVQESMLAVLNQIAQSTRSGAETSNKMLRVASS